MNSLVNSLRESVKLVNLGEVSPLENDLNLYAKPKSQFAGVIPFSQHYVKPFSELDLSELSKSYSSMLDLAQKLGAKFVICDAMLSISTLRAIFLETENKGNIIPRITLTEAGDIEGGATPLCALIIAQSLGARLFVIKPYSLENAVRTISELSHASKIPLALDLSDLEDASEEFDVITDGSISLDEADFLCLKQKDDEVRFYPCKAKFKREAPKEDSFFLASSSEGYIFDNEDYSIAPILTTEIFDPKDIFFQQDSNYDIVNFYIKNMQFAESLATNSYLLTKPIYLTCDDEKALETALYYYKGVPLISRDSDIPEARLKELTQKYGAVLI